MSRVVFLCLKIRWKFTIIPHGTRVYYPNHDPYSCHLCKTYNTSISAIVWPHNSECTVILFLMPPRLNLQQSKHKFRYNSHLVEICKSVSFPCSHLLLCLKLVLYFYIILIVFKMEKQNAVLRTINIIPFKDVNINAQK